MSAAAMKVAAVLCVAAAMACVADSRSLSSMSGGSDAMMMVPVFDEATKMEMLAGMKCAVDTQGFAGSNVFSGMPLTAEAGISYAASPEYMPYNIGSQNPEMASFPSGVGLIGRAFSEGMDSSANVQTLPGDKFLRLDLAIETGAKGTIGLWFPQYESVIEFWSAEADVEWDVAAIKECFA